jgi:hypothetical protein
VSFSLQSGAIPQSLSPLLHEAIAIVTAGCLTQTAVLVNTGILAAIQTQCEMAERTTKAKRMTQQEHT